jgi:hypothetical protein
MENSGSGRLALFMSLPRRHHCRFAQGNLDGHQANLSAIAECDGHGFCAILTEPEVFSGAALAANASHCLLPSQRTPSAHFGKVNAEQSTLRQVLEGRGTMRVETLRQHGATSLAPLKYGANRNGRTCRLTSLQEDRQMRCRQTQFRVPLNLTIFTGQNRSG